MSTTDTSNLIATRGTYGWSVSDVAGGTWYPDADAEREIEASADPATTAERIAAEEPMRGEWRC